MQVTCPSCGELADRVYEGMERKTYCQKCGWCHWQSRILDRILHHCTTINIKGESYRLKERRRQGLVQPGLPGVNPSK